MYFKNNTAIKVPDKFAKISKNSACLEVVNSCCKYSINKPYEAAIKTARKSCFTPNFKPLYSTKPRDNKKVKPK